VAFPAQREKHYWHHRERGQTGIQLVGEAQAARTASFETSVTLRPGGTASRAKTPTDEDVGSADKAVDAAGAHANGDAVISVEAIANVVFKKSMLMHRLPPLM